MKNLFSSVAMDKWAHIAFSIVISLAVAFADKKFFDRDTLVCAAIGCLVSLFFGVAKETLDFFNNKSFDFEDILADLIGCAVGFVLIILLL